MQKVINNGMSLLEILIILSIVAIIAGYSFISFSGILERQKLKSAGEIIFADLRLAQSEAIKRSKSVFVSFNKQDNSDAWCYGINVGSKCDCTKQDECKIDDVRKVTSSLKFKDINLQKAKFAGNKEYTAFEPTSGFAQASGVKNGSIWLQSKSGYQLAIIVNRIGRVRFCSPTLSEYSNICPTPP